MEKKLCLIYNFAPHYRESIYRLIDQEYNCDWFFGNNTTNIEGLDLSILKHVGILQNRVFVRSPWYFQKGVLKLIWQKEYFTYFMLGDVHCLSTWLFVLLVKWIYPHKKVYFWSHGWYGKETVLKRIAKKVFFNLVEGIFLYGNYAKGLMLKEGFSAERLFVIHNSLDYDRQLSLRNKLVKSNVFLQHFGNNCKNLIFIGRLTIVKKLDLLIRALKKLNETGDKYTLTLIGDGDQKENLKMLVEKSHLDKNVWFYGACYNEEINAELIYNADLCVSPGNVGLTAIHSMMFGTPVATHDNYPYQMPEFEAIHEGETGTFFKYNDVDSISEKIANWFTLAPNREKIRQNCYREIDNNWTPQYQIMVLKENLIVE